MKMTPLCTMQNSLIRKLALLADLPSEDRRAIDHALTTTRFVPPKQTLVYDGDTPDTTHVVLDGFACRSKHLDDGGRQIVAYVLPGDFGAFHGTTPVTLDYSVTTLSGCVIAEISRPVMQGLLSRPAIAYAFWQLSLQEASILRAWITNNGRRDSESRIAHLVCELFVRLQAVGRVDGNTFQLPLSQEDIADTVGLSTVHTNRCLQSLRTQGLIRFKGGALEILNPEGLARLCSFNPSYLPVARGDSAEHAALRVESPADLRHGTGRLRPSALS
jgi:CRP-like cAMP-binding protein